MMTQKVQLLAMQFCSRYSNTVLTTAYDMQQKVTNDFAKQHRTNTSKTWKWKTLKKFQNVWARRTWLMLKQFLYRRKKDDRDTAWALQEMPQCKWANDCDLLLIHKRNYQSRKKQNKRACTQNNTVLCLSYNPVEISWGEPYRRQLNHTSAPDHCVSCNTNQQLWLSDNRSSSLTSLLSFYSLLCTHF